MKTKRIIACLLLAVMLITAVPQPLETAYAVTIEDDEVFIHHTTAGGCTLGATTMMLRRTAILKGCSNWSKVTESAVSSSAWLSGVGLRGSFSYTIDGVTMSVTSASLSGSTSSKKSTLISLLQKYPQGIVIYNTSQPHAVLLTKYDSATDTFYCGDSGNQAISPKQIKLTSSILNGSTQNDIISGITKYWYVKSPTVTLTPKLTIHYHANGGTIAGSDVTYDTYKVVTSDGLNFRSGAGTSYSVIGWLSKGTSFTVTETKTSGGYTWGKTTYNGSTGWCVISQSGWATKTGSRPATDYYLNNNMVYKSSTSAYASTVGTKGSVISAEYGLYNITTFGITKSGYTFKGWSTSTSGTPLFDQNDGTLKPEDICSSLTSDTTVTLYAIWQKKEETVSTPTPTPVESEEPTASLLLGDINFDGNVDARDALLALQYCVELRTLTSDQLMVGDVNSSGVVDAQDALLILQKTVGLISAF